MKGQGQRVFVDELTRFAAGHADPRVTAIAERTAEPLRVAVRGRRGAGCGTVARGLRSAAAEQAAFAPAAFREVAPAGGMEPDVEVIVHVVTEVVKPEDADAIASERQPVLAVLSKADLVGSLSGRTGDGPIAAARSRAADLSALVGVPVEPMIGPLAVAALGGLDGGLWEALRVLAHRPGRADLFDLSCDGFLTAQSPVPADVRLRLLDALGLFGTALAVAAVRQGRTPAQVRVLLRRMSRVDAVLGALCAVGAEARYRRVLDAVAELEALAVGDERISGFLTRDDTVLARMAAAQDVVEEVGIEADPLSAGSRDAAAHLSRAVRWQDYSLGRVGPVNELRRACGADIARGSLRLWSQACGSLPEYPGNVR